MKWTERSGTMPDLNLQSHQRLPEWNSRAVTCHPNLTPKKKKRSCGQSLASLPFSFFFFFFYFLSTCIKTKYFNNEKKKEAPSTIHWSIQNSKYLRTVNCNFEDLRNLKRNTLKTSSNNLFHKTFTFFCAQLDFARTSTEKLRCVHKESMSISACTETKTPLTTCRSLMIKSLRAENWKFKQTTPFFFFLKEWEAQSRIWTSDSSAKPQWKSRVATPLFSFSFFFLTFCLFLCLWWEKCKRKKNS